MYGVVLLKSYINMEFKEDEILLSDGIGVCVPNYWKEIKDDDGISYYPRVTSVLLF